jgi:hypothetical protein
LLPTSFVLQLLEGRLLDPVLFEECERGLEHQHHLPHAKDARLIQRGLEALHGVYGG